MNILSASAANYTSGFKLAILYLLKNRVFRLIFHKFLFVPPATKIHFTRVCLGSIYEKVSLYKDAFV